MSDPRNGVAKYYTCTWPCLEKLLERNCEVLMNPSDFEPEALTSACSAAGAYAESLKKPNLNSWTYPEWEQLVKTAVVAFQNEMRAAAFEDEIL